jgi:hypothetical protein
VWPPNSISVSSSANCTFTPPANQVQRVRPTPARQGAAQPIPSGLAATRGAQRETWYARFISQLNSWTSPTYTQQPTPPRFPNAWNAYSLSFVVVPLFLQFVPHCPRLVATIFSPRHRRVDRPSSISPLAVFCSTRPPRASRDDLGKMCSTSS